MWADRVSEPGPAAVGTAVWALDGEAHVVSVSSEPWKVPEGVVTVTR
jgi:hypothetical protein